MRSKIAKKIQSETSETTKNEFRDEVNEILKLTKEIKTNEIGLIDMPRPIGDFIIDNIPNDKVLMTNNGAYYHYADVCKLLRKYKETLLNNDVE